MKRSRLLVFVFCGLFSVNSFATLTAPQKFGWFFGVKFLVDGIATWQQIEQIQALDAIVASLPSDNCQGDCKTNSDKVNVKVKLARVGLGVGVACSLLGDVANVVGLISSINGNEPVKVAITTVSLSVFSFWWTLLGNYNLWNMKDNMAGLPDKTEEETDEAIGKGVVPLVITGIVGIPTAVQMSMAFLCGKPSLPR